MTSPIAGTVLPLKRAEELILTLPSVVSARIVATDAGAVSEIHVLTSGEIPSKQMVRNIESALIAHFGMRVDHRKISVAVTMEAKVQTPPAGDGVDRTVREGGADWGPLGSKRRLYFEDIEVVASRTKGVVCRVTLLKGDRPYTGESQGYESDRSRLELAARATLAAIAEAEGRARQMSLEGLKVLQAFEREYIFVGVVVRDARAAYHLTGSCEVRESAETAAALAILDATNRWVDS